MKKTVYLDNNATTRVADEVYDAMSPFLREYYGNPSSMYSFAAKPHDAVEKARTQVAALINAEYPDEIVFTSCGTESDNAALFGALEAQQEKQHVILSAVEHPAVYNLKATLERHDYIVSLLPVDENGTVIIEELPRMITAETAIVSIMWANNETGVVMPIKELCRIVHDYGVLLHTDAVQAVGKIPVDVQDVEVDLLSLSGHKIHAPKGVGALYIRRGTRTRPFFVGGHQEHGRRAGTENVAGIVGLGAACESAGTMSDELTIVRQLRDKLEKELCEQIPRAHVHGAKATRTPNTTNIVFEGIEGEAILLSMSDEGIFVSSGSACTSGSLEPSHVLRAMGVPYGLAHSAVRFSLSRFTTEEEIQYVIEKLPKIIQRLREMSPFWESPNT